MANLNREAGLQSIGPAVIIETPIVKGLRFRNSTYYVGKNGEVKWSISNEKIAAGGIGAVGLISIATLLILNSR